MYGLMRLALLVGTLLPFASTAPVVGRALDTIPGKFIVTLKDDVAPADVESHLLWVSGIQSRDLNRREPAGIEKTYNISSFKGYAGSFDDATIQEIEASPEVR